MTFDEDLQIGDVLMMYSLRDGKEYQYIYVGIDESPEIMNRCQCLLGWNGYITIVTLDDVYSDDVRKVGHIDAFDNIMKVLENFTIYHKPMELNEPKAYKERPQGDLISREALKEAISGEFDLAIRNGNIMLMSKSGIVDRILAIIDNAPAVEMYSFETFRNICCKTCEEKLRPQGKWINHRNDYGHNIADCSECGKTMQWNDEDEDGAPRFCWYCGAVMKGKNNETNC